MSWQLVWGGVSIDSWNAKTVTYNQSKQDMTNKQTNMTRRLASFSTMSYFVPLTNYKTSHASTVFFVSVTVNHTTFFTATLRCTPHTLNDMEGFDPW